MICIKITIVVHTYWNKKNREIIFLVHLIIIFWILSRMTLFFKCYLIDFFKAKYQHWAFIIKRPRIIITHMSSIGHICNQRSFIQWNTNKCPNVVPKSVKKWKIWVPVLLGISQFEKLRIKCYINMCFLIN